MMVEKHRFPEKLFFILSMVESIIAFTALINLPTDPKNNFFLGFSLNRILMLSVIVIIFSFAVIQLLLRRKHQLRQTFYSRIGYIFQKNNWLYIILLFFCWNVFFLPANQFRRYEVLYSRIQPLVILIFAIIFTFLILLKIKNFPLEKNIKANLDKKTILVFGLLIGLAEIFMISTRIGLDIDHFFWGGAATPILPIVINLSLLIPILLLSKYRKNESISLNENKLQGRLYER